MENIISTCKVCNKELSGKQRSYCSRTCHNKSGNFKYQNYQKQQERANSRKLHLITLKGGKCEKCGYSKNSAALCFHHLDPTQKEKRLDSRNLSNSTWETILKEVEKCQLLCHNCHMETHFPLNDLDISA